MARGRRTRHELRRGHDATQAARDGQAILDAWHAYTQAARDLAKVQQCASVWPSSTQDVAPTRCQKLEGHPPGEDDGGHRHRMLGTQTVVTW